MHVCCWLQFESRREKRHGSDVDADGRPDADTGDVHRGNPDVQPSVCGSECHQSAYQDGCRHAQLSNSLLHRMWHHGRGTERLTLLRTLLTFYCFMTATLTSLGTQNCDERVCLCVCLSRSPGAYFRNNLSNLCQFCMLHMAAAWSFCGGVVIRYVSLLRVSRMTSYLYTMARNKRCKKGVYCK